MNNFNLINGDCIQEITKIKDESIHFSIFSPPFADLYCYSDMIEDLGNCKNYNEFFEHFKFLIPELNRVLITGRLIAVHCMDLPIQKGKEGYIGLRDFSGILIKNFQDNGFIYHTRITIWKDPVIEMQRTKALGLLHKQTKKDSSMVRVGNPDYVLLFRKEGINPIPIHQDISVDIWQKWASPDWFSMSVARSKMPVISTIPIAPITAPSASRMGATVTGTPLYAPLLGVVLMSWFAAIASVRIGPS